MGNFLIPGGRSGGLAIRGSGELDGADRGSGELDGTSRGSGGCWRGAGAEGRSGSAASRGRSGSALAARSWTGPAGALESWAEQALEDAGEEPALEDAGEEQAREDAGKEQAPEGAGEEPALENLKPSQGWTGPAGTTEREEGASHTPAQSPSHLSPPPCPAVPDVLSAPPDRIQARGDTEFTKREALIIQHGTQETQEQQGRHSREDIQGPTKTH